MERIEGGDVRGFCRQGGLQHRVCLCAVILRKVIIIATSTLKDGYLEEAARRKEQ